MLTNEQKAYFEKEWGSFEQYAAAQRARYVTAAQRTPSDFKTMQAIEAEAARLKYKLPTVTTSGGVQGLGGGSSGNIINLPYYPDGSKDGSGLGSGGSGISPDEAGTTGANIGKGLADALSKISLNNFLVIVGVVFGFVILKKAFKAVR